jgi:hypothetical protein
MIMLYCYCSVEVYIVIVVLRYSIDNRQVEVIMLILFMTSAR